MNLMKCSRRWGIPRAMTTRPLRPGRSPPYYYQLQISVVNSSTSATE
jgi:hypothetical protein